MPLLPQRVKHRKVQKGRKRGLANSGNSLAFGSYGMQALERGTISNIQIEACRVAMNRSLKRKGKVWLRIFPDKPVTKKPLEVRMGKGKGNVDSWVAVIKPGRVLFEIGGVSETAGRKALRMAVPKLPLKVKFVQRD